MIRHKRASYMYDLKGRDTMLMLELVSFHQV